MDELLNFRKQINKLKDQKISISDFIIKAVSKSNQDYPIVNSQLNQNKLRTYKNVDVSFAVEIENGLITPIVFSAN